DRDVAEQADQEWLQRLLQERREHEQAPDAIDDARNAGQELDRDADRPAQELRAQFGQKYRDQQPDRNRDQHGNERSDEGAVDRRERTELFGHGIPALLDQEIEAERLQRRPRSDDQRENHAAEEAENRDGRRTGQMAECLVAEPQPIENLGPRADLGDSR